MAAFARFVGSPQSREHWSHCIEAVRTGEVVPKLRGKEGFDYVASEPELSDFNQAMTNFSELAVAAVTTAYDFTGYRTIVDVAGGHGWLLAGILAATPSSKGVLFDLPHVVADAEPLLRKHHIADRVGIAEGSFFDAVPDGGRPVRTEEHHPRLARRQSPGDSQACAHRDPRGRADDASRVRDTATPS
jgi:C-methyltransferase